MAVNKKVDPFETAPGQNDTAGDEAQADITSQGVIVPKENPLFVKADEGKVTVTLKGGVGFNAPWVVIHGTSVSDALTQVNDKQLAELLERAQAASKYFVDKAPANPTQGSQGTSQTQSGQPAASAAGQGGVIKTCKHGQMMPKSGVSQKTGKAWSGHFCPTPQGTVDQCDPQFAR